MTPPRTPEQEAAERYPDFNAYGVRQAFAAIRRAAYIAGYAKAIEEHAQLLEAEAAACLNDIVDLDEQGSRYAHARVSALMTAAEDVRALAAPADAGKGE